jgi:mannose-6-phosphate isomerase
MSHGGAVRLQRLENVIQHYAWGATHDLAEFMGVAVDGRPWAELWMGTHPMGMSRLGGREPLSAIAGDLPFMMKVLAVDQSLSLQVHPNAKLAAKGFAAENAAGIALDAPDRSFRDPNPKPEMVYALTTFDTLVGLRPTAEVLRVLDALGTPLTARLANELRGSMGFTGIVRVIEHILTNGVDAAEIAAVVDACSDRLARGLDVRRAYATAIMVAKQYPEDPGVLVTLLLNRLTLQPGEAAFLDTGILHAHLSGMCVEVMKASDNVLRAGLTSKPINIRGLIGCLDRGMAQLARVTPARVGSETEVFAPRPDDFALAVTQVSRTDRPTDLVPAERRLIVCTAGQVEVESATGESLTLRRGESIYAGPEAGAVRVRGAGEVVQAYRATEAGQLVDLV